MSARNVWMYVDSALGQVYVPFQAGAAGFPNGGISVFSTH